MIVGVNGSPNKKGNTGFLIRKVLEGAEEKGAKTTILDLGSMDIKPCRACMWCKKSEENRCAIQDDMNEFYQMENEITGLVLGTPIYFDHISAQLKTFIDRLYCYVRWDSSGMKQLFPKDSKAVIVATYGAGGDTTYDEVVEWTKGRLSYYHGIETVGTLTRAGCPDTLVVDQDEKLIQEAVKLGSDLQ